MAGDVTGTAARPGLLARGASRWQPWAALGGFAFLLHFAWEMLQAPLYRGLADGRHWDAVRMCTRATVGDVGIALAAYAAAAAPGRRRWWLDAPSAGRTGGYLAVGLVITVALEVLNVYRWGRWAYAPAMPLVLGVGLAPLLQWLALPPLTLWLARRHLGGPSSSDRTSPRSRSTPRSTPTNN